MKCYKFILDFVDQVSAAWGKKKREKKSEMELWLFPFWGWWEQYPCWSQGAVRSKPQEEPGHSENRIAPWTPANASFGGIGAIGYIEGY